ncbi:hypothetical protein FTUN_3794 [Frigoriglobus tundricola]|uniref:Uncharacterized protein n=1 Tax=Frigoriglobus tundricola TaxID=2774151 RepID=A0A6M5YQB3_9BACT|nr:hypothetical protein FTUN_3794 [Frigoriglobus tundricola]
MLWCECSYRGTALTFVEWWLICESKANAPTGPDASGKKMRRFYG